MSEPRIISVSGAPYDGYPVPRMLESLARCGVTHVEPAFIVGYTAPFDEGAFTEAKAREWTGWLAGSGLACHAFSSHIDLGRDDALEVFRGRMDFARRLGATVINTNAADRRNEARFFENIGPLARHAEALGMLIGLENPGDGSDNLLNVAADADGLLARIGARCVGLNYDAGNTVSHRPRVPAAQDAVAAMPHCVHAHVKDVRVSAAGYHFVPLGDGEVGCAEILRALAATPLAVSIEIPLRLHRGPDSKPVRRAEPVPLPEIESALAASLAYVKRSLAAV